MNRRKFFSGLLCLPIVGALFRGRAPRRIGPEEEARLTKMNQERWERKHPKTATQVMREFWDDHERHCRMHREFRRIAGLE